MSALTHLLIIDPQNDFCDTPETARPAGQTPALPVPGADADMHRLAALIRRESARIDRIILTLDSHQRLDIAHPTFWQQADGADVAPFTPITAAQLRGGAFAPRDPSALPRALAYLDALEAAGRYTLMVWPVHCEVGTWGHAIHPAVAQACETWAQERPAGALKRVSKGENPWTEHYSALLAEVPDPADPHTQLNRALVDELDRADRVLVAGEASSHCVRATTEHLVAHWPGGRPERITLLTDCMSPVGGFAAAHEAFFDAMRRHGARLAVSTDAAALA